MQWERDLPEAEQELIAYRNQFFILKEGELHRNFLNNIIKRCIPGRYIRSYIKNTHIHGNQHHLINATKQSILQMEYWWPNIAETTSLFIILCCECSEK